MVERLAAGRREHELVRRGEVRVERPPAPRSGARALPARRARAAARSCQPQSLDPATAMPCAHCTRSSIGDVLADGVRPVDRARAVHQRRRARLQRERRAVVPGAEPAERHRQPERARWRPAAPGRSAASTGVSDGLTSVCQWKSGGCSASHESVVAPAAQEALDLAWASVVHPRASACCGQDQHGERRSPPGRGSSRASPRRRRSAWRRCPAGRAAGGAARRACASRRAAGRRRRAGSGALSIALTAPPSRQCGCSCSACPARPSTSTLAPRTFFESLAFDAVTVAPYMGEDSIRPFLEYTGKWTILLGLTSNTGAADFQLQHWKADRCMNPLSANPHYGAQPKISCL